MKKPLKTRAFMLSILLVPALSFGALEPQEQNGIAYITGGIGGSERKTLERLAGDDYNVKLTIFSLRDRSYRASVPIWIQSWNGRTIFNATTDGPIIYLALPPGRYKLRIDDPERGHEQVFGVGPDGLRAIKVLADPP